MNKGFLKLGVLLGIIAVIGFGTVLFLNHSVVGSAQATFTTPVYPDPQTPVCVEGQPNIQDDQKFSLKVGPVNVSYRWHIQSQTSTTVTYRLQVDVNPTNAETWVNVSGNITKTVEIPECPQPNPCDVVSEVPSKDEILLDQIDPCVTPTPTDTPSDQPKGDNRGDPHTEEAKAPAPVTCNIPFEIPRAWYTKKDGKVIFNWATDTEGIQKFSIVYGYSADNLVYGVDNLPADSRSLDINGLDKSKHTFFQVQAWKDGCMEGSAIIDP